MVCSTSIHHFLPQQSTFTRCLQHVNTHSLFFRSHHIIKKNELRWFEQKKLFVGSQRQNKGFVSTLKAESIRQELEQKKESGIQFNPYKIYNYLEGGTCTAMSLHFMQAYFQSKKSLTPDTWANTISEIGTNFQQSSDEIRNEQTAYNSIEVSDNSCFDHSLHKIKSLIKYRKLKVLSYSPEIDISTINKSDGLGLKKIHNGAYLIRMIKPQKNAKLEENGHSSIYIKDSPTTLFFDPNVGAIDLRLLNHSEIIFEALNNYLKAFQISHVRFYRMAKAKNFPKYTGIHMKL